MKAPLMLLLALFLSTCVTPEGGDVGEAAPNLTEKDLKQLVKKADDWDVPQPALQSKLVKIPSHGSAPNFFHALGFIELKTPGLALVGFTKQDITGYREVPEIPDLGSFPLDNITPSSPFRIGQELNTGLITGIQLVRMGHEAMGTELIEKSLGADSGHPHSKFRSPANEDPELMLARSCLTAAINEISTAKPDFSTIHSKIQRLIKDQPSLSSKAAQSILRSLEASMKHLPASPGTMARLVDDYLMSAGTSGGLTAQAGPRSPEEHALTLKGFEAIPALLAQRKSERFTNHLMQGFSNFVSHPMSAREVIDSYLQRLANDDLGTNWLRRQHGVTPEDDAVTSWWKTASALGEESYVKKHAILVKPNSKVSISEELIIIADDRYPNLLPEFYRKALTTSQSSESIDGFLASNESIPQATRIRLLKQGVATHRDPHRNSALHLIRSLDPVLADQLLLEVIKKAPKTANDEYWLDQDANLSGLVAESTNLEVWRAMGALIERGDLGMRMELIDHLAPDQNAPHEIVAFYLSILDHYINNRSIRRNWMDKRFDGPGAGFPHECLSMRNYIHTCWAAWLEMDLDEPDGASKQKEWRKYRNAVSQAIRDSRTRTH